MDEEKLAERKSKYIDSLVLLYNDIDSAIAKAGTKEEFDRFSEESFNYYKDNLYKKVDPTKVPFWPSTIQLGDVFYFAAALQYLMFVQSYWSSEYLTQALLEELDHYEEAEKNGMNSSFFIRFFKHEGKVFMEPSTFLIDYNNTSEKESKEKLKKVVTAPERPDAGSDWDEKMLSILDD